MPMVAFFVVAGMFMSVIAHTVMRAYLVLVVGLIAYLGLSLMARVELLAFAYLDAFMWPIWGLQTLNPEGIFYALAVMMIYGGLAGVLWWRLTVRFNDRSLR